MTITTSRRGVVEIVEDIAKADEGTADLMVSMLAYDALCDEVDRIGPQLERDVSRLVVKRAEGALQAIAKRWHGATDYERAELEELAGTITAIAMVAKDEGDTTQATPDDPKTPWWDARNAEGRFVARGVGGTGMRRIAGGLNLFTGQDKDTKNTVGEGFDRIAGANRYDVARALGRGLQRSGVPGTQSVGSLARMVGDIGPEAQRVFGRGLTRLAYRYRGTERRPDPLVADASRRLAAASGDDDQKRLETISRLGVDALWRDVPNQKLAELSLASGKMPPSQGIIFDAQGHAVSQSVGYNGDHYLPFDLKNLKRLRGGQYVRTRTTGGLTDEDIYTGLLTGARKVTVVSNSGVFSIEFDPQLRGGRRYSDKAHQMVGRYAALVNTIDQGEAKNLLVSDLDAKEKADLRTKAFRDARGNKDLAETLYKEYKRKARFERKFTSRTDEELNAIALEQAKTELRNKSSSGVTVAQRQRDLFHDMRRQERAKAVRFYQLDGDGYSAAQDALAQEFPYFIRKKTYEPLDEWIRRTGKPVGPNDPIPPRPGKDIGFTRRNALAPKKPDTEEKSAKTTEEAAGGTAGAKSTGAATVSQQAAQVSWSDALHRPNGELRSRLRSALARSLEARRELGAELELPPVGDPESEVKGYTPDQWGMWVIANKGASGAADWLLSPNLEHADAHYTVAIQELQKLKNMPAVQARPDYNGFDEAIELINRAKLLRKPFADSERDWQYAEPDPANPAPQPVPEVFSLGPDLDKIESYASDSPDVADKAQVILDRNANAAGSGDKAASEAIAKQVAILRKLRDWPTGTNGDPDPARKPTGVSDEDINLARLLKHDPDSVEEYRRLEEDQEAWALARATEAAAASLGVEVPDLAPKAEAAKAAPRDRRQWFQQPGPLSGSPRRRPDISKRFRTGRQLPSSSIPPLAVTLAKRLADDPRYLDRLWSGSR